MKNLLFADILVDILFLICAIIILATAISLGKVIAMVLGIIAYILWLVLTTKAIIKYIKWKRGNK
jgi:hypothetical protein